MPPSEAQMHQICIAGETFADIKVDIGKLSTKMDNLTRIQEDTRQLMLNDRVEFRGLLSQMETRTRGLEKNSVSWEAHDAIVTRVRKLENFCSEQTGKQRFMQFLLGLGAGIAGALVTQFL